MTTATSVSAMQGAPGLLGQIVALIGGGAGIGLEIARRARRRGRGHPHRPQPRPNTALTGETYDIDGGQQLV